MRSISKMLALTACVLFASLAFGQNVQNAQGTSAAAGAPEANLRDGRDAENINLQDVREVKLSDAHDDGAEENAQGVVDGAPAAEAAAESAQDNQATVQETAEAPAVIEDAGQTAAQQDDARVERPKTKLGVLWLQSATGHDKVAYELTPVLTGRLDTLGLYEVYRPDHIDKALQDAQARFSANCHDQKCVIDIGKALGLRRMVYGSVDMAGSQYAVRLVLMNAVTGRPVETVSIEGAPGVPAKDVLFTAVERLHGGAGQADVSPYYGPPVNNLSEFLWSTVAVQGTGIFYSLINYGAGGGSKGGDIVLADGAYGKEKLSGIPASANQIPIFARPAALANAYTAVSDDAYGVLYNPAGMAWVTHRDAAAAYQSRFFGMNLFAVSYANRATRDLGFGQALLLAADNDGAMTEVFFVTAAGYRFNEIPVFGPLSVGASIKFMGNTVKGLSEDSPSGQSYGFGLDLGFMWQLSPDIRYGLMFRDLPSINKWNNKTTEQAYTEALPPTLHMGGSYRAGYSTFLTADGQIPLYGDQPWVMAGGIEYEFFRMLALRIGLQREILDEEANWWKITCGAGIKIDTRAQWGKSMALDVAYEYNTLDLFPVLNVSVRVGF